MATISPELIRALILAGYPMAEIRARLKMRAK